MPDFEIAIGNKNYSSWSLRGWLALSLTGARFRETMIPLFEADWRERIAAFSPAGKVPVLRHGAVTVWETLAIAEYLGEVFTALWPKGRGAKAHARSVMAEMHSGFLALRAQLPMNLRRDKPAPAIDDAARADIARIAGLWRDCRARHGNGGPYLFGTLSLADAFYAPVVSRFTTYRVALPEDASAYCRAVWEWPALCAWREAALAEPWIIAEDEV